MTYKAQDLGLKCFVSSLVKTKKKIGEIYNNKVKAKLRKKIIPAANELLAKIKILPMPSAVSNKLKGFRIDNVPPGSIVESAGIKNGDIIYSIEGQQLTSMREAWSIFDQIKIILRKDWSTFVFHTLFEYIVYKPFDKRIILLVFDDKSISN